MQTILGGSPPEWILANSALSLYMTGVIWFVQLVHYPLLARVGAEQFVVYERQHTRRTGWVVGAPMLCELIASVILAYMTRGTIWFADAVFLFALVAVIWVSTFALQVPCHNRLEREFDEATCRRLVQTNWLRTVAWTVRSIILLAMVHSCLKSIATRAG